MISTFLAILLIAIPGQATNQVQVSDAQKRAFVDFLKTLPTKGEFYTDDAAKKAGPYMPVLFALTEEDIQKQDLYPFLAISRALSDDAEYRGSAVRNFPKIRHPKLKLFWAAILFDGGSASPEVKQFLRDALTSNEQIKQLSEMMGPQFEALRKRVLKSK
jgi:hypothetical protein